MKLLAFVGLLLLVGVVGKQAEAADDAYKLLPGDRLQISVWREDVLDREVTVLPDGSITFPLVGRTVVQGKSTPEVEQAIVEKLETYLAEPVVTVTVSQAAGYRVYLVGQVENPGPVVLDGPTTISQILSLAGGFGRFAELNDIRVLRGLGETAEYLSFDYDKLISGEDAMSATMLLEPGDVIIVP